MRRLKASSLLSGARETATRVTSRAVRCTTLRSKLSVTRPRELLLLGEKRRARRDPLLARNDPVAFHLPPPSTLSWSSHAPLVGLPLRGLLVRLLRAFVRPRRSMSPMVAASTSNCACQYLL